MKHTASTVAAAMKAQSDQLDPRSVAWIETGEWLVNVRRVEGAYQWRLLTQASGPGAAITESRACELIESALRDDPELETHPNVLRYLEAA